MNDGWTALLAELAKAEGYREGVKAALGVIEGVSGDYCNEWAVDALGSCKSEIEALLDAR